MTSISQILADASKAPVAEVLLTFVGLFVLAFFSWAAKRWFCHRDRDQFLERKKRMIDELCGLSGGILLFSVVSAGQFIARTTFAEYQNAGTEIAIRVAEARLGSELIILSIWAMGMLVATTAFRAVLGKIDYKLQLEADGHICIPSAVDYPFPRQLKGLILCALSAITLAQGMWMVNVFADNLDILSK